MMYCSYCGKLFVNDALFCYACGKKVVIPDADAVHSDEVVKKVCGLTENMAFPVLQEQLRKILDKLSESEQKIIKMRFGLEDDYTYTLAELSECLNVTRDDIRKAEANAFKLLKPLSGSRIWCLPDKNCISLTNT